MKKIISKYSGIFAALALVFTTLTVNSACTWMTHQEKLPEAAKKLRKF
ncbi:MAG: cyclic lactone autoinducer peptide [Clostridium sp.]|nr:cyclic lactone autoinducer peptide [Clostridium sp.]